MEKDRAEGLRIAPLWPTACWFSQKIRLQVQNPRLLPRGRSVLRLPHSNMLHPLQKIAIAGRQTTRKSTEPQGFYGDPYDNM